MNDLKESHVLGECSEDQVAARTWRKDSACCSNLSSHHILTACIRKDVFVRLLRFSLCKQILSFYQEKILIYTKMEKI